MPGPGYGLAHAPTGRSPMMTNDLSQGLLTVLGVLAGLATLLFLVAALDPKNVGREKR